MNRNLKSIADFAADGPFTQGQLRWWSFQGANNGLDASGAIVRVQRRVYLDTDCFDKWVEAQNRRAVAAA